MTPHPTLNVSVTIYTDDEQKMLLAVETLSRTVAGLALEGIDVSLTVSTEPADEVEEVEEEAETEDEA